MLDVENLSKSYTVGKRNVQVLKNISFHVDNGEILGFLGRSGGGKSTLMKIIRGMEDFDSGRIVIDDLTIEPGCDDRALREQNRVTAIHLQRDFGLWTESALKNVVRRVHMSKTGYETLPVEEQADYDDLYSEAMEYLRLVGLERKANHLATLLSGGEKQRLLIARQIAKRPKVLLLDEPATMACPATKQEVMDTILKINKEMKLSIMVVSHLPEVHEYLDDRLIWLDGGQIQDQGEPGEILRRFLSGLGKVEPLVARPAPRTAIQVDGISKRNYLVGTGEVLNIDNLRMTINEGEITSLIGSSGAGKTTILKIIEGLRQPDSGSVFYRLGDQWVDIVEYSPMRKEVRRNLGIMYQEFALSLGETILSQIAYKLGVKGTKVLTHARTVAQELGISDKVLDFIYTLTDMQEEEAKTFLGRLGLTTDVFSELFPRFPDTEARRFAEPIFSMMDLNREVLDKYPEQLSGGESVRAALSIIMASNPKILLLDEPFGDIDPITLREVSNALKRINKENGTTVLLVSHHVDFVREVSHRAILIQDGAVVMDGSPDEICDSFISRCGATYLKGHMLGPLSG